MKSNIGQAGDQVTLLSPMKTFEEAAELSFYYHMWLSDEDTAAALTVYAYLPLLINKRLVEIRGNQGTGWKRALVCLPEGIYQLAFVATHGLQFLSDIALDEIQLFPLIEAGCGSLEAQKTGKILTCTNIVAVYQTVCNVSYTVRGMVYAWSLSKKWSRHRKV